MKGKDFKHVPIKTSKGSFEEVKNGRVLGEATSPKGNASPMKANHHDGIVMGGSVTHKRPTVSRESVDRLPSGRSDGRIL